MYAITSISPTHLRDSRYAPTQKICADGRKDAPTLSAHIFYRFFIRVGACSSLTVASNTNTMIVISNKVFTPPGPSRKAPGSWRKPGGTSVCFE